MGLLAALGALYYSNKNSNETKENMKYNYKLVQIINHMKQEHNATTTWNNHIRLNSHGTELHVGLDDCYLIFGLSCNAILVYNKKIDLGVRYLPEIITKLKTMKDEKITKLIYILEQYRVDYLFIKYKKHLK